MTETPTVQAAGAANRLVLRQGIELPGVMGPERYRRRLPVVFAASMGGRFRHIIDHEPETTFGVAPSTLRYPRSLAPCAR